MTDLHVWHWTTEAVGDDVVDDLMAVLSAPEREQAGRFVQARDRRDYVAAHALLRHALAWLHGRPPEQWRLEPDTHGKPGVVWHDTDGPSPQVSLSHAPGLVACAVSPRAPVGVDVEPLVSDAGGRSGAVEYFAREEVDALGRLSAEARGPRFTELWVLREAYVKGLGLGLWGRPAPSVWFDFDGAGGLVRHGDRGCAWEFGLTAPGPGYRMAVAMPVEGAARSWRLSVHPVVDAAVPLHWKATGQPSIDAGPALRSVTAARPPRP